MRGDGEARTQQIESHFSNRMERLYEKKFTTTG